MSPGQDDVFHLCAHGRRQHDIGIGGGIGNKMIRGHMENIFAFQPLHNLVGFR